MRSRPNTRFQENVISGIPGNSLSNFSVSRRTHSLWLVLRQDGVKRRTNAVFEVYLCTFVRNESAPDAVRSTFSTIRMSSLDDAVGRRMTAVILTLSPANTNPTTGRCLHPGWGGDWWVDLSRRHKQCHSRRLYLLKWTATIAAGSIYYIWKNSYKKPMHIVAFQSKHFNCYATFWRQVWNPAQHLDTKLFERGSNLLRYEAMDSQWR